MHFAGLDLAWGDRSPTGVAVLDHDGRLVQVVAVRSDDEIVAALAPYTGELVVGVDAPLIVTNATGNRAAEAALNKDFARFDAGAHPVNTAKPEIGDTPRGARIADRLGLALDPDAPSSRRAIEVYPHAATVALFRLGRTLKYKNKPGRDLESLRGELLALIRLIEGLATADPPMTIRRRKSGWAALVTAVEQATRKTELRVVEDQVDAVVCAYVALFATRVPQRLAVYGSAAEGRIVTPALPADHRPAPRPPRTGAAATQVPVGVQGGAQAPVARAVREYTARFAGTVAAQEQFISLVTSVLDDAGINYLSVTGRTKSVASFAAKAARRAADGTLIYPDPLRDITDQIGVRVITYTLGDVDAVADLMGDQVVVKDDRDMGRETASQGRFGYASRHLLIALDAAREGQSAYEQLRGRAAALQVRTVLQHAWAEFEHEIRYKGTVPGEHASEFDRRFTLAAGLLELADREFSSIRERLTRRPVAATPTADDDLRIDPGQLAAFLAGQYADAGWSRTDHYDWISGLLLELGITSIDELGEAMRPVKDLDLNARMDYKYPPGAVRRLDDALLAVFGDRYTDLPGNAHRVAALRARGEKLRG